MMSGGAVGCEIAETAWLTERILSTSREPIDNVGSWIDAGGLGGDTMGESGDCDWRWGTLSGTRSGWSKDATRRREFVNATTSWVSERSESG